MQATRTLSVLLLLAIAMPARAGQALSLDDAMQEALSSHTSIRLSTLSRDQADAAVRLAQSTWDPVITAGAGANSTANKGFLAGYPTTSNARGYNAKVGLSGSAPTGTSWSVNGQLARDATTSTTNLGGVQGQAVDQKTWGAGVGVSVSQDLLAPFRDDQGKISVRTAREHLDQAEVQVLAAQQDGLVEVARAWWDWSAAVQQAQLAAESVVQAQQLEERTRAQVDEGEMAQLELDRVSVDLLEARRNQLEADTRARKSADALLVLIGRDPGAEIEPAGDGSWSEPAEHDAAWHVERALEGNLGIALAQKELDAAVAAERDAKDAGLPTVTLTGSATVNTLTDTAGQAISQLAKKDAFPVYGAAVDFSVPLGGRAAHARRDDAGATVAAARLKLEDLERQVNAQTLAAVDAVETAQSGVKLAQGRLEVATRTEEGEQARVDEGVKRLDELLVAMDQRRSAEVTLVTARMDLARAEMALAALEGSVLEGSVR